MGLLQILRRLRRSPMFTALTVITLGTGIGATTAIFAVVEGVLLKPLPYSRPNELVAVEQVAPAVIAGHTGAAPFLYFTYRQHGRAFQDVAMWTSDSSSVTGLAEPEQVDGLDVTDGLLPVLGVRPVIGRTFSTKDDSPGSPETVMLSFGFWQRKFGGDTGVIGRRIIVDGRAREIIGVLPKEFWFLDRKPTLIFPMRLDPTKTFIGQFSYSAIARLKPGVTIARANVDVARMIPVALQSFPPFPGYERKMFEQAGLAPNLRLLKEDFLGDIGKVLWVLMGTIGVVLLIACANVANLLLVRAEGRQQELAIRAALGADWKQIARDLLLESLTLGALGGVLGIGIAHAALRLLVAIAPANLPRLGEISIDGSVLLFTLVVSLFAGVLFGSLPIFKYAVPRLATMIRAGGRTASENRERHGARNTLVVVQVALATVLLISSGLMIRTFYALTRVDPGFVRPETLQTFRIAIPESQVREAAPVTRMQQIIAAKIAAIPGVSSVAMTSDVPMSGGGWKDAIYASDKVYAESKFPPIRHFKFASPGLQATMGNRLVAGRDFTWTDVYERRPVAMISENVAREMWGDPATAVGKQIRDRLNAPWREVIGVTGDERDDGMNQRAPKVVTWPILMDDFSGDKIFVRRSLAFMIRSERAGSLSFLDEVQHAVWSVNPNLPLRGVRTMRDIASGSLARTSFTMVMLGIAGGMALLLGVVGIYGVISYSVSRRRREIGIRMALGSPLRRVIGMFVTHGLRLAGIGVACGVGAAIVLTRLMSGLLFEVRPIDPPTFVAVAAGLVASAALASYFPASRAASVDPVEALRAE